MVLVCIPELFPLVAMNNSVTSVNVVPHTAASTLPFIHTYLNHVGVRHYLFDGSFSVPIGLRLVSVHAMSSLTYAALHTEPTPCSNNPYEHGYLRIQPESI